ncbi:uncharacterized protein LOC116214497 [Punica granatum]|nr:uncharacterized protein LOC116214497 [Punica granatum]
MGRFTELLNKYREATLGIHCSVSGTSITGLYTAIKNYAMAEQEAGTKWNRTTELAASTGRALTRAVLCNKGLFPVRVPIMMASAPRVARFLARRRIIKDSGR